MVVAGGMACVCLSAESGVDSGGNLVGGVGGIKRDKRGNEFRGDEKRK